MASSCHLQRTALLEALAVSTCISEGRSIKECIEVDAKCSALNVALYNCKRGQLDMRKRIKGNVVVEEGAVEDSSGAAGQ